MSNLLPPSGQKNQLLEVYKCIIMDLRIPIFKLFSSILLNDKSLERKRKGKRKWLMNQSLRKHCLQP